MTSIVFHLGDRKTGSKSIQITLASGAWTCDSVRLLFPQPGKVNHIPLSRSLTDKAVYSQREPRFRAMASEIEAKAPDVAIISAEDFESADPLMLREAVRNYMPGFTETARYIAYVRPHADRLVSEFAEQVKQGSQTKNLEDFHHRILKRGRFQFINRFRKWREAFGEQFELRPMIRDRLFQQDVVADLLQFTLNGAPFKILETPRSNESLMLEDLSVLQELQRQIGAGKGKPSELMSSTGWMMARRMNANPRANSTKLRLHRSLAEAVVLAYREDAAALDAEFFAGTPMSDALASAPDKSVDVAQSIAVEDVYSGDDLRMIRLWTGQVAEMLLATPEVWPKLFRSTHRMNVIKQTATEPVAVGIGRGKGRGKGKGMQRGASGPAGARLQGTSGLMQNAGGGKPGARRKGQQGGGKQQRPNAGKAATESE